MIYFITPVSAPRMTRSDKWKKRPCVVKYFSFRDEVKKHGITIEDGDLITFTIPMPNSWSAKKKALTDGLPHRQRPDIDNLCKALLDSVFDDDCHLADLHLKKKWGFTGSITVKRQV